MTAIKRVTLSEMIKETGMPVMGYANPKKDKIFLLKGLTKDKEKEVLAHEHEHISKNEEGPFWGAVIGAGVSLLASRQQAKSQEAAAQAGAKAADPFGEYRSPFQELLLNLYGIQSSESGGGSYWDSDKAKKYGKATGFGDPVGLVAAGDSEGFMDPLGLLGGRGLGAKRPVTRSFQRTGAPSFNLFRNLPGYQFSLSEMMRAVTRGAAAGGGLGSGRMLAELQQRAGGLAEQTYSGEMARLMTLAGADKGSPGTAGSILSSGMAGAAETRSAGMIGAGQAIGYGISQYNNNQQPYSGISGVNRGSQQDLMLAEQNEGLF